MRKSVWTMAIVLLGSSAFPAVAADDPESKSWLLKTKVEAALLDKGGPAALPIQVAVDRKTVILTGEVESVVTQELAKEVAMSVRGVSQVENRLRVAGEKTMTEMSTEEAAKVKRQELSDGTLEAEIKIALYKEIGTKARHLEVEAVEGVVSLRGPVPDEARKTVALATAKKTKGVKSVVDLLAIEGK
jgi:osmotically-inducible protein OsmY